MIGKGRMRRTALLALALGVGAETQAAAEEQAARDVVKLSWEDALQRTLARNPSAIVAAQEVERASALVWQARAAWLPSLSGNGTYTRYDAARTLGGMVATPVSTWNGNLQLTVPLIAPTAWMNDSHAQDNGNVTAANAADVRRQLAESVARAYLTTLLDHRQVEVALRAREVAMAHYAYTHERLERGFGNAIDDARASQEVRTTEAQLQDSQTALARAQSALAILVGEADPVDAQELPPLDSGPAVGALLEDGSADRTDVRLLQEKQRASAHLLRDTWVYYAPTLLMQAQTFDETRTALQPRTGWQASLIFSIPLFDGGLRHGIRRERRAADEEARAQLEGLLRQAKVEVRTAVEVVHHADESLAASRAAVTDAVTAAELADKAYRAGATTNIEVIDAQRQARDAESQAAMSEDNARQARLDLLVATGAFP